MDNYVATFSPGELRIMNKKPGTYYDCPISLAVDLAEDDGFSIERYKSNGDTFLVHVYYKHAIVIQGDNLTGISERVVLTP